MHATLSEPDQPAEPDQPLKPDRDATWTARWRRRWLGWASLLLLTLCIRGGVLIGLFANLSADVDGYRWLAESLAVDQVYGSVDPQGEPQPTAFRPPLYPLLLSVGVHDGQLNVYAVAVLHLLWGLFTVAGTYWLGRRMLSGGAGWVAGFLVAIDPILLVQSTYVMTETLAVALCVGCWMLWLAMWRCLQVTPHRRGRLTLLAVGLTGLLVAAFFCRPTFLIWAVLLCGYLVLAGIGRRQAGPLATALVVASGLLVSISGWAYRNQQQLGHPVWATSHGGYTLLLGNNPPFYEYLRQGSFGVAWDAEPFHRAWTQRYTSDPLADTFWDEHAGSDGDPPAVEDEVADDRLAYQVARETIRQQPAMFAWACVVRAGRLWSPLPHQTADRGGAQLWLIAGFYGIWFGAVAVGLWRLGRRLLQPMWVAGMLLAIALTAVHLVYWSNMRMRAPATPLLALVAAAGVGLRKRESADF